MLPEMETIRVPNSDEQCDTVQELGPFATNASTRNRESIIGGSEISGKK